MNWKIIIMLFAVVVFSKTVAKIDDVEYSVQSSQAGWHSIFDLDGLGSSYIVMQNGVAIDGNPFIVQDWGGIYFETPEEVVEDGGELVGEFLFRVWRGECEDITPPSAPTKPTFYIGVTE